MIRWPRNHQPKPGTTRTVTVTLFADTRRFAAAMDRAALLTQELERRREYRDFIWRQWALARCDLDMLLDDWCTSYGWNPRAVRGR